MNKDSNELLASCTSLESKLEIIKTNYHLNKSDVISILQLLLSDEKNESNKHARPKFQPNRDKFNFSMEIAMENQDIENIRILLEDGESPNTVINGKKLIEMPNNNKIIDLLTEYGAILDSNHAESNIIINKKEYFYSNPREIVIDTLLDEKILQELVTKGIDASLSENARIELIDTVINGLISNNKALIEYLFDHVEIRNEDTVLIFKELLQRSLTKEAIQLIYEINPIENSCQNLRLDLVELAIESGQIEIAQKVVEYGSPSIYKPVSFDVLNFLSNNCDIPDFNENNYYYLAFQNIDNLNNLRKSVVSINEKMKGIPEPMLRIFKAIDDNDEVDEFFYYCDMTLFSFAPFEYALLHGNYEAAAKLKWKNINAKMHFDQNIYQYLSDNQLANILSIVPEYKEKIFSLLSDQRKNIIKTISEKLNQNLTVLFPDEALLKNEKSRINIMNFAFDNNLPELFIASSSPKDNFSVSDLLNKDIQSDEIIIQIINHINSRENLQKFNDPLLVKLIKDGHTKAANHLITQLEFIVGNNCLLALVEKRLYGIIEYLLENPNQLNQNGCDSQNNLIVAARNRDKAMIDILLKIFPKVKISKSLFEEAILCDCDIAEMFLQMRPQVSGNCIVNAITTDKYDLFLKIYDMQKAADLNNIVVYTKTSIEKNRPKFLEFLLERHSNIPSLFNKKILHFLFQKGKPSVVDIYIKKGIDIHSQIKDNESSLTIAVAAGNLETSYHLIRMGVVLNPDEASKCLAYACANGYMNIAKLMISWGANMEVRAAVNGMTPLTAAVKYNHREIIKLLLESGSFIDNCTTHGVTPLMIACVNGYSELVEEFIRRGASLTNKNYCQRSALSEAIKGGKADTVEMLLSKHRDKISQNEIDQEAIQHFIDPRVLQVLVENGVSQDCYIIIISKA